MFEEDSRSLRVRSLSTPLPLEAPARVRTVNPNETPYLREMQMLLKFREGGPGFSCGAHEERRAQAAVAKGWLTAIKALFKSRYDRYGSEIVEYRNRYTLTEDGREILGAYERRTGKRTM
jgi:hypothetical protein